MSPAGPSASSMVGVPLDRLAARAAHDLGVTGVIVTRWRDDLSPLVVAVTGRTRRSVNGILPSLASWEQAIRHAEDEQPPGASATHSTTLPEVGAVVSLLAALDHRSVGAVHLIVNQALDPASMPILRAYAAHLAVGIAASRRTDAPVSTPPELIHRIGDLPLQAYTWTGLINGLAAALADDFGEGMIGLMLWQGESDTLQMTPGSFGASRGTAASYRITISHSQSNAARVMSTGSPYLSNTPSGDAGILQEYVDAFGVQRLLSVPIVHGRRSVGVMHLANGRDRYTIDDLVRLQALTPHLARAILASEQLFALRRRERLEGILADLAVAIASGRGMQDFLPRALEQLTLTTDADLISFVLDEAPPITSGLAPEDLVEALLARARMHPDFMSEMSGPHAAGEPGSTSVHVPVHLGSVRVGTVSALRCRAEPFTPDEQYAFKRLAKQTALAWATERYQHQRAEVARATERHRIADDLHDDVAQSLFAARLPLDATLAGEVLDPVVEEAMVQARDRIAMAEQSLRTAIHQLSSTQEPELVTNLYGAVDEVEREFGIGVHVDISDSAQTAALALPVPARDALVRVTREALVNTAKHAGPCRVIVTLSLRADGMLALVVSDDGVGRGERGGGGGHGIASLRRFLPRHGGSLSITHGEAGGTTVSATIPTP